ncbi:MAG TPA: hypothetical protein VD931_05385 [Baekduia sp.]|nr:hypothetical protein [Baekduia sp.]
MRSVLRSGLRLWALVVVVLAVGGDAAAHGQTGRDCYDCPLGPGFVVPGLTDLNGWQDASRTILFGDLTGDEVDELIARGSRGIEVYRFDRALGQWSPVSVNKILADSDGWAPAKYSGTIRVGDVDGTDGGRAELIARSGTGIDVYRLTSSSPDAGTWTQINTAPGPFPDKDAQGGNHCFSRGGCAGDDPSYYSTIQLADTLRRGPAPRKNLIGRGGDGLEVYEWNGRGWDKLAQVAELADVEPQSDSEQVTDWRDPLNYQRILAVGTDRLVVPERVPYLRTGLVVLNYDVDSHRFIRRYRRYYDQPLPPTAYRTAQVFTAWGTPRVGMLNATTDSLEIWDWSSDDGWRQVDGRPFPGFSAGPQYFETIQPADVDGDGRDETIGRGARGILTDFREAKSTLVGPALADDPWATDRSYYGSIQTARLDPDSPARSLVARGPFGIRTWRFDTVARRWVRYPGAEFPAPPGGTQGAAYESMRRFLGVTSIRARYSVLADTRRFSAAITATCTNRLSTDPDPPRYESCTPPAAAADVSAADWTTVCNQVLEDTFWATIVNGYFDDLAAVLPRLFLDDKDSLFPELTADLHLPQAEHLAADVSYRALWRTVLGGLTDAGLGSTSTALGAVATPTASLVRRGKFEHTPGTTGARIFTITQEASDVVSKQRKDVTADHGLLVTVGRMIASKRLAVRQGAARSFSRQGYMRWFYKAYLPLLWDHWAVQNCGDVTSGWCGDPGPAMTTSGGRSFDGLVPKQDPCGVYCSWFGLESHGFGDAAKTLRNPVAAACRYDATAKTTWQYGRCTLGVSFAELFTAWGFRSFSCDYSSATACYRVQPQTTAVHVAGQLIKAKATQRQVDLSLVTPLARDLDLRGGRVKLAQILHEAGGAGELVDRRNGSNLTPRTLRLARGATRRTARFATPPGFSPRVRGTMSVDIRKVRVRRGRSRKLVLQRVPMLRVRLRVDGAKLQRPRACRTRGKVRRTSLGLRLTVRGRHGKPADVRGSSPWRCTSGGRVSFRYRSAANRPPT